jgi:hypothetical protein
MEAGAEQTENVSLQDASLHLPTIGSSRRINLQMPSQSTDDVAVLRRQIAKLETAREIERMERMVRELQATVEKKDLEQKMERMQAQATLEKKDLEQTMGKRHMEQKMERMQAQAASEKNERGQQIKRIAADVIMRSENEKRDRLLENEKRDREADRKEAQAQHQIDQLKWEARFSQMEQQQAARAYNIQQLPNPLQYAAGTVLPLAPQKERVGQLQPAALQELRPRKEETGPSYSVTPVTAATTCAAREYSNIGGSAISTAISSTAISSTAISSSTAIISSSKIASSKRIAASAAPAPINL